MRTRHLLLTLLALLPLSGWCADGDVFQATSAEGINLYFTVVSEEEKTCKLGQDYSGTALWSWDENVPAPTTSYTGVITIPAQAAGYTVVAIGTEAFDYWSSVRADIVLTGIVIPSTVKWIESYAFYYCYEMEEIDIPGSVERLDDQWVLYGALKKITLHEGLKSVGMYAFYGQPISEINLPSTLEHIGEFAFNGCSELQSVKIPEKITALSTGIFTGCSALTSVVLPEGLTSIGQEAFYGCSQLEQIQLPASVTEIASYAFRRAGLRSFTFPAGLTTIEENVFEDCDSLAEITIPSTIQRIGRRAFAFCDNLQRVTMAEGVTSIGNGAFEGCEKLASVTIPASVTNIEGYAFASTALASLPEAVSVDYISEGEYNGCPNLLEVTIPSHVTSIGSLAFASCPNLEQVNIHDGVTFIGVYAFSGSGLRAVPEARGVDYISMGAFNGCPNLLEVTIPSHVVTVRDYAFSDCDNLQKAVIPGHVKELGDYAFAWDNNLKEVTLAEGLEKMGYDAFCYTALKSLSIPASLTEINDQFSTLSGVTTISVAEGNTRYDSRGGCNALIETATNTLLRGCSTTVIPGDVEHIGEVAFENDTLLTTVNLPAGVKSIGGSSFGNCKKLSLFISEIETPFAFSESAFYGLSPEDVTLKVPEGTEELYKSTEGWTWFWNITTGISRPAVAASDADRKQVYDLSGRCTAGGHGLRIVRSADGKVRKVMF